MSDHLSDDAGAVIGNAGGGELIRALGREWWLGYITPAVQAAFCSWCRMVARQQLIADRRDPAELAAQAAQFTWGRRPGKAVAEFLESADGQERITLLLLKDRQPSVTEEDVAAIYDETPEELGAALRYLLGLDPNRQPPVYPGMRKARPAAPAA